MPIMSTLLTVAVNTVGATSYNASLPDPPDLKVSCWKATVGKETDIVCPQPGPSDDATDLVDISDPTLVM